MPRFGAAKVQADFETVPAAWRDDSQYVSARRAIRFKGVAQRFGLDPGALPGTDAPQLWAYHPKSPGSGFHFAPAFRRLFCDGIGAARVDIGLWVVGAASANSSEVLLLVRDVLELDTEVLIQGQAGSRKPLRRQAKSLANLFQQSTESASGATSALSQSFLIAGAPAVVVDETIGVAQMPSRPTWFRKIATRLGTPALAAFPAQATVVPTHSTDAAKLAYTTLSVANVPFGVWFIKSGAGASSSGIRHCLLRLHSARQVLMELQRMAVMGRIPMTKDEKDDRFAEYLSTLANQVLKPRAYGADMAELQRIVSMYDAGQGGLEREMLERTFSTLPLNRRIRSRVLQAVPARIEATNLTIYSIGALDMSTNTGPVTHIAQSGNGTITIQELTQVTGDYIRQSEALAGKVGDADLKASLDKLREEVQKLATALPDTPGQEAVARKLKQLTEEASSAKPDKDTMQVTGKGLVEAAKAVAEMAAPVATAVKAVLSLVGVALL